MNFLEKLELFSPTVENRFVFQLFDVLLCGVIVLVIARTWRARLRPVPVRNQLFLFLTFCCLGASFALGAIFSGGFLFFQVHVPAAPFDFFSHLLQFVAWVLLAAAAYQRPLRDRVESSALSISLVVIPAWRYLAGPANTALDIVNLFLLALALVVYYRRPLGGRGIGTSAVALLLIAALLHLGSSGARETRATVVLWNLEQLAWSLSLFTFALAIGETSRDLFDRVFVRLQIAFILLASVMILVITQTEKTEYVAGIRSRSEQLAQFVRAQVDYFRQRGEPLPAIVEREDFLERLAVGFGNLPELRVVRISAGTELAAFEIAGSGEIQRTLGTPPARGSLPKLDPDEYFSIHSLPLTVGRGEVEFHGAREFLIRHIRKRIILIFSLFTGMVALSTLMIGLVVRGAGATIRRQAREIEETQRRLMQSSKLAAIGELAAGVAHEINNPVTTILSRASFLTSQVDSAGDHEDLSAIVAQAQRIAQITKGLLVFARPQALDRKAVPIERIVETSLRSVKELLAGSQISVHTTVAPHLSPVMADEGNLVRALENLLRNAIDAMPDGGKLEIRAARDEASGERLRLEIADTGLGIPKEHLPRIFDPFFTTKEVGKGTGLGLSIVHGIVKEHRGNITVKSRLSGGTCFEITLPTEQRT